MDWILRSPQIHSTFSNLGSVQTDGYHVNENCNSALETILHNILSEDKYLRTYRRSISVCQNIKKDIIPLFIHAKDDRTLDLILRILVNLTTPIECLLNVDLISKTDDGQYTIIEVNNFLASIKVEFTDLRASKALVDFLKKNVNGEQKVKLSIWQRTNVSNCLLLLRNILHIPENNDHPSASSNGSAHSIQNQILWNIFSQSIDKIIIKSMTILDASFWGVTLVQLVSLLYKDQNAVILHKLLNNWLEASPSESSEDNESNTYPPDRVGSEDSSPMLTSDPATSDSSDNGGGDKCGDIPHAASEHDHDMHSPDQHQTFQTTEQDNKDNDQSPKSPPNEQDTNTGDSKSSGFGTPNEDQEEIHSETTSPVTTTPNDRDDQNNKKQKQAVISEICDCGYGTHIENHEFISPSIKDDLPTKKPVHQKPHNVKQRPNPNSKPRLGGATKQDRIRKKIVKRGKANIINVKGLNHKKPTDDDISNVLKEFTVDFLLKGYNSLVQTLHNEILTNPELEIDTSHFFWLVTYFLKFATQIQLDLEHVESVLSYEIVSFFTSEGVNLCEQFELAVKLDSSDLSHNMERQHLVITAIQEFIQAIELYKKIAHFDDDAREKLTKLQIKMCETEDLRSMLVLFLRHFNPKYHSKEYLKDLIVTNHTFLMFLDNVMKFPEYNGSTKMIDLIQQYATPEIMAQYGLLLGDYLTNEKCVNDYIFTLMHHVAGDVGCPITLFQSNIIKTFTSLGKSDFEICDVWTDLVEYVLNSFVKKPNTPDNAHLLSEMDNFDDNKIFAKPNDVKSSHSDIHEDPKSIENNATETVDRWTEDEISALSWNYMQSSTHADVIGKITSQLREDGIDKTKESVNKELFRQNLIGRNFYERELKGKCQKNTRTVKLNKETREDEIARLCEHLRQDGKATCLDWVQKVLLDICYAKLYIQRRNLKKAADAQFESKLLGFEIFRAKREDLPVISPVAYHSLNMHQSVPLVPWNCQQASVCKDLKFLQLLHKLGFHMPVDTGKVFIRIPHFWTPDFLFSVAGKVLDIDTSKLKFSISELSDSGMNKTNPDDTILASFSMIKEEHFIEPPANFYQIHKQNLATMVNFTPRPGPSFKREAENGKIEQLNWLQFVQKSQERTIDLNLESITETAKDMVRQLPPVDREATLPVKLQASAFSAMSSMSAMGAMGTMSSMMSAAAGVCPTRETSADADSLAEPEIYSSAFETASVASGLIHMYVSDEDEKPEEISKIGTRIRRASRTKSKFSGKRRREH